MNNPFVGNPGFQGKPVPRGFPGIAGRPGLKGSRGIPCYAGPTGRKGPDPLDMMANQDHLAQEIQDRQDTEDFMVM